MAKKINFGPAAARRIVAAVKKVEGQPINLIGRRRGLPLPPKGGGLPTGTGRGKVLQFLDDLDPGTPGWDYPTFHPLPTP